MTSCSNCGNETSNEQTFCPKCGSKLVRASTNELPPDESHSKKISGIAITQPTAAWYLAPIFMGIIGSAIMWYVLKDDEHPNAPKMVHKGWIIGIVLTVIFFVPFVILGLLAGFSSQI
jgi:hypothetical protein